MWTDEICQNRAKFAGKRQEMDIGKKKAVKPKKGEELGLNPYLQELLIEATKITEKDKYVPDEDGVLIPTTALIERQKAVKVYRIPGGKERAMNLSAAASKMLLYIIYTVEGSNDYIAMTPEQYTRASGCTSRNTYKKAVEELWRYCYIQPTIKKYVYWVNPLVIFGGNRINKWPEKVVIKTEM